MTFPILVALLAAAAAVLHWRHARLAGTPAAWPPNLTFKRQLRLARSFLRHDGWTLLEAEPARNIFIRARRQGAGLAMMIHGEETLSLPTLLNDCIAKAAPFGLVMGILSRQTLSAAFQDDAARNGIYVINPTDLPDITTHIRRTALRQKQIQAAATAPLPAVREPAPAS